jgi:hypothetical protein
MKKVNSIKSIKNQDDRVFVERAAGKILDLAAA